MTTEVRGRGRVTVTVTAVDVTTSERVDVLLDLRPGDPVSAVEAALRRLLRAAPPGIWLHGTALDPDADLAAAGVRPGCVLALGGPLPHPPVPAVRAELQVVSGPDAGSTHPLPDGATVVGRDGDVAFPGGGLERPHLLLHSSPAGVVATDLGRAAPVRRDGVPLTGPTPVGPGELLEVGGRLLAVVPTRAARTAAAALTATDDLGLAVSRPPRLRPPRTVTTVELPALPPATEHRPPAVLPLLLPVVLGVVMALVGSPVYLLLALASPLLAVSGWWSERSRVRRAGARDRAAHAARMAATGQEVERLVAAEAAACRELFPDPAALRRTATGPGPRLWERRGNDDDSLVLRLGTGTGDAQSVRLTAPAGGPRPAHPVLADVPVTLPLREVGVLGVSGASAAARALARWLVAQAVVLHSPEDLSVWLLVDPGAPASAADWGWLRWVPHAAPAAGQDCAALVGVCPPSLSARVAELGALVAARSAAVRPGVRGQVPAQAQPDLLVVLDGAGALRGLPGLAPVLRDGPAVGVHVLCVEHETGSLPEECRAVVTCDGSATATVRRDGEPPRRVRPDLVGSAWADDVARALAPLRAPRPDDGQVLPASARLLELLDLEPPSAAAVLARWGRTTAAVVGVGADGPVTLDLRHDGPHALVAGTTGAGKSELLQALVASLAVANRPDAMTFVLVDYKGGAAFQDCARLPHTVGMVTDLDGHLVERALASLSAELRRREELLAAVGASDVEGYWAAGAEPLPRLVIVIDEFASLAEELPDFVRGLVGIAQRGRSLGVHLVLATQRPCGVVSPEIRANTNLRIALRVTDAAESLDVLDAPDAATIGRGLPGRAFVRTGHASLSAFQTARVSGPRHRTTGQPAATRLPWSRAGAPLAAGAGEPGPDDGTTDLQALVEAVRAAADELGLPAPRSPWLAPLPAVLTVDDVHRLAPSPAPLQVVLGLEDLPAQQGRRAAVLDLEHGGHLLVAGAARSGRTTLLRTLGASLAASVSPADAHLYALDCGSGGLLPLADLPHTGAVVSRSEVERADRLLSRLAAEVSRRQELLAAGGHADVAEQRAAGSAPLPYLVLLVDRWEGFTTAFDDVDAGRLTDTFLRLLREGPGAGLRVVVTGDRSVLLGKAAAAVEDVLVLRLADRSDYTLAGLSPRLLPDTVGDGRAFRADRGTEVQVALLAADPAGASQAAAVAALARRWSGRPVPGPRPLRVDTLPLRVTAAQARALPTSPTGDGPATRAAVVGVGGDELARQSVDLARCGPGFTVAGPSRSGRSTALLAMARDLLGAGSGLFVLSPRPSPVRALAGEPGVLAVVTDDDPDPAPVATALGTATGPLTVLVDDAELLGDAAVADLLAQVLRTGRDRGHTLVLAGTTEELATSFRGFAADARRSRSGLLLSPESHLHGELLGLRLPRSAAFAGPPGRGVLVRDGRAQLVQVPLPD